MRDENKHKLCSANGGKNPSKQKRQVGSTQISKSLSISTQLRPPTPTLQAAMLLQQSPQKRAEQQAPLAPLTFLRLTLV